MPPLDWLDHALAELDRDDLRRQLPPALGSAGAVVEVDGRPLVNFSSNDYLDLASDRRLIDAAIEATRRAGVGRGASPLVSGRSHAHVQLEQRLARFERSEAALLFPTGYAANAGVIPALVDKGDAIYGDAKNHASIIDGCRLSRADRHVYPHCDASALAAMLREGRDYRRRLIVTDSLFSMDGDLAPLPKLAELAHQYDAMLVIDEAHATGVFGAGGRGVVEHFAERDPQLHEAASIRIGTLSKAIGSAGGFVCGSQKLVDWLANRARSFVFSTAHPAAASAAAIAALRAIEEQPEQGTRLLATAQRFREQLRARGWRTGASQSQIIPIEVGSPSRAIKLSVALRTQGFWVPAIRPPSVPEGESLLRLSLTTGHTEEMLAGVLSALGTKG